MLKRLRLLLILLIPLVIGGAAYAFLLPRLLPRAGRLSIASGNVTIQRANGETQTIDNQQSADIYPGDTITAAGWGHLDLVASAFDLEPLTSLRLDAHMWLPFEGWRVQVTHLAGNLRGYTEAPDSTYRLDVVNASADFTPRNDTPCMFSILTGNGKSGPVTALGVLNGVAELSTPMRLYPLRAGQGVILKTPLPTPVDWGSAALTIYGSAGSAAPFAPRVSLLDTENDYQFTVFSGTRFALPPSKYTLSISNPPEASMIGTYTSEGLMITPGQESNWSLTLAEVVINLLGEDGKSQTGTTLRVSEGDQSALTRGGERLLTAPGVWALAVAREDQPQMKQPAEVTLLPGQIRTLDVQDNLFGGSPIKVVISPADSDSVPVMVHLAGKEAGAPIANFMSNAESPLLPPGRYVLRVLTAPIAARIEVEIVPGQTLAPVEVKFGRLRLNYTDSRGGTLATIIQVALADQMARLKLPITDMAGASAGKNYVVGLSANQEYSFPVGTYNFLVIDSNEERNNIRLDAGQTVTVDFKVKNSN